LDGFSQSHFICKYSIQVIVVQRHQPLQPYQLVVLQVSSFKDSRLFLDLLLHSMGQIIINSVRIIEVVLQSLVSHLGGIFGLYHLVVLILGGPFLDHDLGS